ncbi:hypothetical protein Agub_g8610 [Astrephomene gubernaculifera]|uniref:Histone RNA hairpin-binding protein RNA-binding domain-containing protein n=1 Tax=Astrephomene gubernaculifera TaxID=47775 RepID=A0AAD3DRY8_9CHLO|nr:hypothetical protein Agub_g8610 [Astrephomene gubernaculifera]
MAGRQKSRPVADYSADFEVEDVPAPRSGRDREYSRGTSAGSGLSRWPKQPRSPSSTSGTLPKQPIADLDPHRLAQRQKQIDYGKNTLGYQRYLEQVPKNKRRKKGDQWLDPVTPDINQNISKRCFDGQIKVWRRALHKYDLQPEEDEQHVRPIAFADRNLEDVAAAAPSSPTNSGRSRGSLDGYLEPMHADSRRKRCFESAFDHVTGGNPHPSKLLTSPAGPRPVAPQSAPPATAADAEPAPTPAGRCVDPPTASLDRAGLPRGAVSRGGSGVAKVPLTAPPAAARRATATSTADATEDTDMVSGRGGRNGAGEDLFREWEEEDFAGLEAFEDEELEGVQL